MARDECKTCGRCLNCCYTNDHMQACGIVYTEIAAQVVWQHEVSQHPKTADQFNDIDVRRAFREIVAPQVDARAAEILNRWLASTDRDEIPDDIPRLWK